ncbi:hypothetical protein PF002_g30431 [Phytophthora fragariae]|nr:hypothetical protein PF002_g30431 [Phytophthora fragariae]
MFVAREGHGFDELPPIALDTRWNMVTAGSLTDQIAKGVADIAPVLDNVKLRKSRHVNASSNVMPDSLPIYSRSTSQVAFVRLERTERSAHIVLTHAEKYNIARSVFDLEGLARLGSSNFYKQIQLWEGVIPKFMADNGAPPGDELNEETEETRTYSDSDCTLELDDDFFDLTDMLVLDDDAMTYEVPSVEKQLTQPTTLPSATLQASATLVPCGTTLLQNTAKLLTPATTLTPVSALADVKAPPPHAPCHLEGPDWNLADFDSCPSASQVSLGTLDMSELSQTIVGVNGDSVVTCRSQEDPGDGSEDTSDAAMSLLACAAGKTATDSSLAVAGDPERQVSVVHLAKQNTERVVDGINLPPHVEGKPREQKVRHWAAEGSMRRYITVTYPKGLSVNVIRLMHWATHTRHLDRVKEVLDQYPVIMDDMVLAATSPTVFKTSDAEAQKYVWTFVVPNALVISMQAAIDTYYTQKAAKRKEIGEAPEEIDLADSQSETRQQSVVKLRANLVFFSSSCVLAMKSFHDVSVLATAWTEDMAWLRQNWFEVQAGPVKFFASETRTENATAVDRSFRYDQMAAKIMVKYELATLTSKYSLRSMNAFINFNVIVGAVVRVEWLTGAAVNYGVAAICDGLAISLHDLDGHFPKDRGLYSFKYVVVPVNTHGMHWTVIVVTIDNGNVRGNLYDPLHSPKHQKQLECAWHDMMLPFLRAWAAHRASYATDEYQLPDRVPKEFVQSPQQPDGGSCGIMVLAMIHTLVRVPSRGFVLDNVTADYVKVLRLRFLWVVMCGSLIHATEQDADDAARATDEDLVNAFKTQAPKKR